jgi:hypothetical protein
VRTEQVGIPDFNQEEISILPVEGTAEADLIEIRTLEASEVIFSDYE